MERDGQRNLLICAYENRMENEDGVRVLVASLAKASPHLKLRLYHNPGSEDFDQWVAQFPMVDWRPAHLSADKNWNVKPWILLEALDDGYQDVLWLDADLLVSRDFTALMDSTDANSIVVAEEANWGTPNDAGALRTRGWGLEVGRELPVSVNSCFLKVSARHRPLIEEWQTLLSRPDYLAAQTAPWDTRPPHMLGDQDVLMALLCSARHATIPVRFLRRGHDILQLFGPLAFTLKERAVVAFRGLPLIIHAQGTKPWRDRAQTVTRGWYERLFAPYQDTSPYILFADRHLSATCRYAWLKPQTLSGRWLRALGLGSMPLSGAPVAAIFDAVFGLSRLVRRLKTGKSGADVGRRG